MAETAEKDITIRKGATYVHAVRVDDQVTCEPIDLTGSKFRWQGRKKVGVAVEQFDLELGSGLTIRTPQSTAANKGWLDAVISDADTEAIADKFGVHALKWENSTGEITVLFAGCITYEEQVTEDPV